MSRAIIAREELASTLILAFIYKNKERDRNYDWLSEPKCASKWYQLFPNEMSKLQKRLIS